MRHRGATLPFDRVSGSPPGSRSDASFPEWVWASGEESSDPLVRHVDSDGVTILTRVDELGGCGHLDRMEGDCADVAAAGAGVLRYGMPWQRTEVEPGVYDGTLWDRALAAAGAAGLEVVVDLCHFGLPDHLCGPGSEGGGFSDPVWVDAFLSYVEAFLARYPGPRWFTPVNEPITTAFCSALWGAWNDGLSSIEDYGRTLVLCELADATAAAMIRADRPAAFPCAEALQVPALVHPSRAEEAETLLSQWFAALDLRTGHPLDASAETLLAGVPDEWLDRLEEVADPTGVIIGHDIYPVSVQQFAALDQPASELSIDDRVAAWESFARRCADRYGLPIWVAETSNLSLEPDEGPAWLDALAAACARLRAGGVDVRGICWYSRGDQLDWDAALVPPAGEVTRVGLYDMQRRPRPSFDAFRRLAALGAPGSDA